MSYEAHIESHTGGVHTSTYVPDGTPANIDAEQQECARTHSQHHCWP